MIRVVIMFGLSVFATGVASAQSEAAAPPPPGVVETEGNLLEGALIMAADSKALPHAFEAGWQGAKVCEIIQDNDEVRAARCTFPPGVGHERHWHGAHFGYIAQGTRMRTTDAKGATERDLPSGASWWSDGVEWHEALNVGTETAVYIIVEHKKH